MNSLNRAHNRKLRTELAWLVVLLIAAGCEVDAFPLPAPGEDAAVDALPGTDASGGDADTDAGDGGEVDASLPQPDATPPMPDGCVPTAETCNERDDDCDGDVDETFDLQRDPRNCGSCGERCQFAHAAALCSGGACVLGPCEPGFFDLDGAADNGCEYACSRTGSEKCDGIDNDCDGATDEGVTPPDSGVCRTKGACANGTPRCAGAEGWTCEYDSEVELDEDGDLVLQEKVCDGNDGDCDGAVDESFQLKGTTCHDDGVGACRGTGTYVCNDAGDGVVCNITSPGSAPSSEVCNGIDDDCDGEVDNGDIDALKNVQTSGGADYYIYEHEASRPDATSSSQGALTHRACSQPDVIPWTNVTHADAQAACEAAGMRLCSEQEWQLSCEGTAGNRFPYGDTFDADACNGKAHDPDCTAPDDDEIRPTAEPHGCPEAPASTNCVSEFGATDLSGNVKEWTGREVDTDTYRIRGGAMDNIESGLTCQFDFAAAESGHFARNLGFRCCRSPGGPTCSSDGDCDNGLFCDGTEQCTNDRCELGTPPTVDDGVACTQDTCDEEADSVVHTPVDARCDDGNPCTIDTCNPNTGCRHEDKDSGTPCSDGRFCNGAETCDDSGNCTQGPLPCDDGDPCTRDECDEDADTCNHPSDSDKDDDGFDAEECGGQDCNDSQSSINPDATEDCNGIDDDCDLAVDENFDECGCPTYQDLCGGSCIVTNNDPDNCGSCDTSCGGSESICHGGACVSQCPNTTNLEPCNGECVDQNSDPEHCGGCDQSCSGGQGCVGGSCAPALGATSSSVTCDPIAVESGTGRTECSGDVAATTFRWATCSCASMHLTNELQTDAFDSRSGPYSETQTVGGGIGTNGDFHVENKSDVGGTLWVAGTSQNANMWDGIQADNEFDVAHDVRAGGKLDLNDGPNSVGRDAFVEGNVDVEDTTNISNTLHIPKSSDITGPVSTGSTVHESVDVSKPCECGDSQIIPIGDVVSRRQSNNDNDAIGLSPDALVNPGGTRRLDLPCGEYYLSSVQTQDELVIAAHGKTALFIDGDLQVDNKLWIKAEPDAEFDVFVAGTIDAGNEVWVGRRSQPANTRLFVGGSTPMTFGNKFRLGGFFYAPKTDVVFENVVRAFGGMFLQSVEAQNKVFLHYDRAVLEAGARCEVGDPGCGSCRDCENQACIDGQCSACQSSSDCCSPLVCQSGECVLLD